MTQHSTTTLRRWAVAACLLCAVVYLSVIQVVRWRDRTLSPLDWEMGKTAKEVCRHVFLELGTDDYFGRQWTIESLLTPPLNDDEFRPILYPRGERHWELVLNPDRDAWLRPTPGDIIAFARWEDETGTTGRVQLFRHRKSSTDDRIITEGRWNSCAGQAFRTIAWRDRGVVLSSRQFGDRKGGT